ncbi:SPFH domain-containing protein [Tamaricihabitans halophyticus]|nr:SPFH domain-containing protein [Tamaricihabitans halophyticus]
MSQGPTGDEAAEASSQLNMPTPKVTERAAVATAGMPMAILGTAIMLLGLVLGVLGLFDAFDWRWPLLVIGVLVASGGGLLLHGLTVVDPGEARVVQFLGRYTGTIRTPGLRWVNPLTTRRKISTKIRNHETGVNKVNDLNGSPIEITAVVVWQVEDTAQAVFEVDDFRSFVSIQTETAVRHIANSYPYDAQGEDRLSLRDNAEEITSKLSTEIRARVGAAGVRVIESRLTRLAYAPEIASAMLRRQQASAVVAARKQIVNGAVGMVELALNRLEEDEVVELDEERKASMVSNLLVVLCADRDTQPIVNTGTLYQ